MADFCSETRNRIRIAVAAWAYEKHNDPIMSDADFDALAAQIDLDAATNNPDMDIWFSNNFVADTGMWVLGHPDTAGLERIYRMLRLKPQHHWLTLWLTLWLVVG